MFKVLDEKCNPTRATKYSAMVDLYAREDVVIGAGCTSIVNLGVKIDLISDICEMKNSKSFIERATGINVNMSGLEIDKKVTQFKQSHYLELHPRSSLRAKGLIIGVGICDLDYPDELGLIVHKPLSFKSVMNIAIKAINKVFKIKNMLPFVKDEYVVNKGDKIAQCTLKEHKGWLLGIESDVERSGGFGSTGK